MPGDYIYNMLYCSGVLYLWNLPGFCKFAEFFLKYIHILRRMPIAHVMLLELFLFYLSYTKHGSSSCGQLRRCKVLFFFFSQPSASSVLADYGITLPPPPPPSTTTSSASQNTGKLFDTPPPHRLGLLESQGMATRRPESTDLFQQFSGRLGS